MPDIRKRKIWKGIHNASVLFYTYEVWVLSVLVAELQHSGLLSWGGFPFNNITNVNAQVKQKAPADTPQITYA